MSTRDERVVSLKFDNAQFERGASESMSTLDKLKEKLKFKDSEKDLDKLQRSVDNVSFTKIQKSLESLEQRFSVMGIAGMRVIENLVDKALSGLGKIEAATLGQIRKGGWSRAMNLANAQFQIEGLGYAWEQVEKAVSYGVQDTAYGLDAAASAASQLAASGVDFTKVLYKVGDEGITQMHKALRGISGVAAMTNSQYEDISRIFTRVAGQGKVMATDLNSIAARGLNAAAEIGKYLGVTEAQVRDMVSKSQIDFMTFADAMDSAFGDHAKEANKTFQGALSNMKAALSRIGALFATPVINKSNNIFNAMTKQINNAKNALADTKDEMTGMKIERFESHFSQAWDAMTESVVAFIEGINPDWFKSIADVFDKAAIKLRDFFTTFSGTVERVKEKVEAAKESIVIPLQDAMAAFEIFFNGKYGNGNARVKALQAAGRDAKKVQTLINAWYKAGFDPAKLAVNIENTNAKDLAEWLDEVRKNGYKLDQTKKKLGESTSELTEESEQELTKEEQLARTYLNLADALEKLTQTVGNSFKIIGNVIKDAWSSIKKTLDPLGMSTRINDAITWFRDLTEEIKRLTDFTGLDRIEELSEKIASGAGNAHALNEELKQLIHDNKDQAKVRDIFDSLARSVSNVLTVMRNLGHAAFNIGKAMFRAFRNVFSPTGVAAGVEDVTWTFANLSEALVRFTEKAAPLVEGAFTMIFSAIKSGISIVKDIVVAVGNFFSDLAGVNDATVDFAEAGENVTTSFKKAPTLFERIGDLLKGIAGWFEKIPAFFHELSAALSDNDGIKRLRDSFSGFGDKVGEVLGKLKPLKDDVADTIGNQNSSKSAAQTIADAIGWIADKLAAVVEWAPKAIESVGNFFGSVKNTIAGFFGKGGTDRTDTDLDKRMAAIYGIPQTINESVSPDKANETSKNVGSFFGKIGEAIKNAFKSIDFGELKNLAILGVTLYSLVSLGRTADRVSSVPKSISKLFKGIGDALTNYTVWEARLKFLEGLVQALISLSGWIVIMGSIDQLTLSRGLAVMLFLTVIIGLVTSAISNMNASKQSKILQQNGIVNMYNTVSGLAAIGVLLLGFAAVMYSLAKIMQVLDGLKNVERSLIGAIAILAVLIVAVGGIVWWLVYLTKTLKPLTSSKLVGPNSTSAAGGKLLTSSSGRVSSETERSPLTGPLLALAAIFMSLATSVAILSIAAAIISKLHVSWTAIGLVTALVVAMSVCVGGVVKAAGKFGTDVWQMLGIAAAIISFSLAIKIMATAIVAIIAEVALIAKVAGTGAAIAAVVAPVLAIVAVIGVISHGIVKMAEAMSKLDGKSVWAVPASLLLIAGIITALGIVLGVLAKFDPMNLLAAAGSIGLVMVALGASVAIMTGGKYAKDPKAIMATAVGLIAMAGAITIISYAIKNLAVIPVGTLAKSAIAIGLIIAALTAAVAIIGKNEKRIAVITSLGKMLLGFGAGALLFGAGLMLINASLPAFAEGLDKVLTAVDKHKAAVLIVGGVIIGVMALAYKFLKPLLSVLNALGEFISSVVKGVGKGIGAVASTVGNVLSSVWTKIVDFFKTHGPGIKAKLAEWGNSFKTWILGLPTKIKALLTILMISLGAQMSSENGSASLLGTVGKVFSRLMKYLRDGMPKFVGEILDLLLSAVEALGNGVRKRSARFASAFWVIVSTLIGLLADILGQGLGMLGIKVDFSDAAAKLYKKAAFNSAAAEFEDVSRMYDLGEATLKEKLEAQKKLAAAQEDLVKSSEDEVRKAALQDKGVIADSTSGIKTSILHLQEAMERIKGMGEVEAFDFVSKLWGEDTAKKLSTALEKMGTTLTEFGTDEGFKKVMEFAALREAVELEQARMSDLEDKLGYAKGTLYDENSKIKWADNDYGEASWFLTVFAPYLKTDQKYIDYRNKLLEDTDKLLDFQAEIQAKAYNITHGTKLNTEEFAKEIAANKKLYGEQTDYYKRMQALHPGGGMEDVTLKGNLNYNLSQGYGIRSDIFYANQMADGFLRVYEGLLGNGLSNSREIVVASFQGMATDKEIIAAANEAGNKNAAAYVDANTETIASESGVDSTKNKIGQAITKIGSWVSSDTNNTKLYNAGYENGKNITLGQADGILDPEALQQLRESAKVIGEDPASIVANITDQHSPSKVFAALGANLSKGLAVGISEDANLVANSSSGLAERAIAAFGNPLEYVSKIMSGELTYDPSIRPIMDMSSVRSGAMSINGMFQNQNVAVAGFSGRLAADIGQLQRDNQDVVDEIALLREDMADMTERMTNLQVVMNNGALVGQLAPGMDGEIGWRATRKGRGI